MGPYTPCILVSGIRQCEIGNAWIASKLSMRGGIRPHRMLLSVLKKRPMINSWFFFLSHRHDKSLDLVTLPTADNDETNFREHLVPLGWLLAQFLKIP